MVKAVNGVKFSDDFKRTPLVAILRGVTDETVIDVCGSLFEGGVRFVEVTLNSPDPIKSIAKAVEHFEGEDIHIGAGTVLSVEGVDQVAEAGGTYIVSPNFNPAVVRRTKELGLISIPGFFSPSEAFAAVEAGADYLKCFPVHILGLQYLKAIKAVLPTPVIAVGGINLDNIAEYLEVAEGVGVGSALYSAKKSMEEIKQACIGCLANINGAE